MIRVVALCSNAGAAVCGSAASKKPSIWAGNDLPMTVPGDQAEDIERNLGLILVGIADKSWLKNAVIVGLDGHSVAEGIAGFDHQQIVDVEINI
jgi:hypothetical protein